MTVLVVSTFLAILALVALAGVALTAIVAVADRFGALRGTFVAFRRSVRPVALPLAAGVAITATAGSLYFSEVAGFIPCALCWYQRIAMYPLALILGIAAWRNEAAIRRYVVPVAAIGAVISLYHIGVERLPGLPAGACSLDVPCDLIWVERFGFVTIPVMALAAFLAIITLLLAYAGRRADLELEATS
jgi:disulfide bond formation protein DsbB